MTKNRNHIHSRASAGSAEQSPECRARESTHARACASSTLTGHRVVTASHSTHAGACQHVRAMPRDTQRKAVTRMLAGHTQQTMAHRVRFSMALFTAHATSSSPGERASVPPHTSQVKSSQVKSSQVKSSQVEPSRAKSSQVEPSRAKSSQVEPSRAKSSQVEPRRLTYSDATTRTTPCTSHT